MKKLTLFLLLLDVKIKETSCNSEIEINLPEPATELQPPSKGLFYTRIDKGSDSDAFTDIVRIARHTQSGNTGTRPNLMTIVKLIRHALGLVKKRNGLDEDNKRSRDDKQLNVKEETATLPGIEKEESQFKNLKSFIQSQNKISDLIRVETNTLKELIKSNPSIIHQEKHKNATRLMIEALIKLNGLSSVLLNEKDSTKTTLTKMPIQMQNVLQSEIKDFQTIIEHHNLDTTLQQHQKQEVKKVIKRDISPTSEPVILKALSKLNRIASVLLKDKQKREEQPNTVLSAIPKLAAFIQRETSEIRNLVKDQSSSKTDNDELKKSIGQSLANDKLITKAIVTLNDITQSLLQDVNFTTTTITSSLPKALTGLIRSETSKIRKLIDSQNSALASIVSESENLARAEQLIQEARLLKGSLVGPQNIPQVDETVNDNEERILELISSALSPNKPLLAKIIADPEESRSKKLKALNDNDSRILELISSALNPSRHLQVKNKEDPEDSRREKLLAILAPLLSKNKQLKSQTIIESEQDITDKETQLILKTQLTGQKAIVHALARLTNITRRLLDDRKEPHKQNLLKNENKDEISNKPNDGDNDEDFNKPRNGDIIDDDFDRQRNTGFDRPASRKRNENNDRIRKTHGQQKNEGKASKLAPLNANYNHLFEEFVKLAIERQRWDQGEKIVAIIRSQSNNPERDNDYYEYGRSRPRPRPRRKKTKKGGQQKSSRPSNEESYDDDDFTDEDFDEDEDYFDYEEENERPLRSKQQRPIKQFPKRVQINEEFDFDYDDTTKSDDYIEDGEEFEELDTVNERKQQQITIRNRPHQKKITRQRNDKTSPKIKGLRSSNKEQKNSQKEERISTPTQEVSSVGKNEDRRNKPTISVSENVRSSNAEVRRNKPTISVSENVRSSNAEDGKIATKNFPFPQRRKTETKPQVLKNIEAQDISERDDEILRKQLLKKLLEKRPKVVQNLDPKASVKKLSTGLPQDRLSNAVKENPQKKTAAIKEPENAALKNLFKISNSKGNSETSKTDNLTDSTQEVPKQRNPERTVKRLKKRILRKKRVNKKIKNNPTGKPTTEEGNQ